MNLKTFQEQFGGTIDSAMGTTVLHEWQYRQIQADVLRAVATQMDLMNYRSLRDFFLAEANKLTEKGSK